MWFVICLLCLAGAYYFWQVGEARRLAHKPSAPAAAPSPAPAAKTVSETVKPGSTAPLTRSLLNATNRSATNSAVVATKRFPYRLTNTRESVDQLVNDRHAILLENALIDTRNPLPVIPRALRAQGDPGTYIVQSRGPLNDAFRALLAQAGATVISYIPNHAYLVRASAADAGQLLGDPQTQAVVPYEPYYKLKSPLLDWAAQNQPLPAGAELNVLLFADTAAATTADLRRQGFDVLAQTGSPFGPVLRVQSPAGKWASLAQLPGVQLLELSRNRAPANDLSRVTMGISTDTTTPLNYLGLTGTNVLVNINDTGVDATNTPDLLGRVFGEALSDTDGHGTHVAGIIAGSGLDSSTVATPPPGSVAGADFRGKAPGATLFSLDFDFDSDQQLQEKAALTNALISNNSWNYPSDNNYDLAAASYDAAVRDALPEASGSQPIVYVFSAGNDGGGDDNGLNGDPNSIDSPGTAKNVITVGAVEQFRNITNEVTGYQGNTNSIAFWQGETDSSNQVAAFSSRGNVGIGIEGDAGRFKPDVVAPGTFVVSTRSGEWDQAAYYNPTNFHLISFGDEVDVGATNYYPIFVPLNAVQVLFSVDPLNPLPLPNMPIYANPNQLPGPGDFLGDNFVSIPPDAALVGDTTWIFGVSNPTNVPVAYNVQSETVTTNDFGDYWTVLSNLNETVGPDYRFESGTSMSAGAVSGLLALMEDFFTNVWHTRPSPALLKAMLINGARPVNSIYNFHPQNSINYAGWGLPNLTNTLPMQITNGPVGAQADMFVFDQDPTNALATGQSWTRTIALDPAAQAEPLRITLAWTDPPGNPAAGVKLVNDLDLVVTDLDHTNVYYGNDIPAGANFNVPGNTNAPNLDSINNVENVFLRRPLGTNYSITVVGRGVNVNAVTANPNEVAQDYALVISSGDGDLSDALTLVSSAGSSAAAATVTAPTNTISGSTNDVGVFLLHQRVGANSPLLGTSTMPLGANPDWGTNGDITIGLDSSWHFYVITNTGPTADFTNAAFATFLPPDLSPSRVGVNDYANPDNATRPQADIDLYVSTDPTLTNLNPTAMAAADKSLSRGGTESIVFTDSQPGNVYYIGVKAEDQKAAEYGFIVDFSNIPFDSQDQNGNEIIRGLRLPTPIPDGSPNDPGVAPVVAISPRSFQIRRVVVTNTISHQDFGDLFGELTHANQFVVLNNHTFGNALFQQTRIYEDNGEGDVAGAQRTDGPGSLVNFIGEQAGGVWLLTEADNALSHTGQVDNLSIRLEPQTDLTAGITNTVGALSIQYYFIDVPPGATNLTISLANLSSTPLPLQLLIRRGALPTLTTFDKQATIPPPAGSLSIGTGDLPPLQPGRYFIGVYNPNTIPQTYFIQALLEVDVNAAQTINFTSTRLVPILDDAVTNDVIDLSSIPTNVNVFSVNVGVAIQHPRVSDLALTLISPSGTRTLLMENRGGLDPNGAGGSVTTTNVAVFTSDFESAAAGDYPSGIGNMDGWAVVSNQVSVVDDPATANSGNQFLALADGTITRTIATVPGQTYTLTYAYRGPGIVGLWRGEGNGNDSIAGNNGTLQNIGFTNGVVGQAFACDPENYPFGTYNGVKISDLPVYALTNSLSIEGWIRPRGNGYNIFWRGDNRPGWDPYVLSMQGNTNLEFYITDPSGAVAFVQTPLAYGQWYHVAGTLDGNSGAMRIYINGTLVNQVTTALRPFGALIPTDSPGVGVGNVNDGGNNFPFWGDIDEISLYSRALSDSEVGAIFSAGSTGKFDPATGFPQNLAEAQVSFSGQTPALIHGNNSTWQTNTVTFTATGSSQTLTFSGLEPGMLIDSVKLTGQQVQGQYLVFTEDTNLTQVPIKYATPPFTGGAGAFYANNFNTLPIGPEWSDTRTDITPIGGRQFLGQFGGSDSVTLTLNTLPKHSHVTLGFDFFEIRSWDGNYPPGGPDFWGLQVAGQTNPLLYTTFSVPETTNSQSYPSNYLANFPAYTGASETNTLGYNHPFGSPAENAVYHMQYTFPDANSSLQVRFYGNLTQSITDESWGLDNVAVSMDSGADYFPEESLGTLENEPASGPWKLEILDDRAGPGTGPTNLVSWQLQFFLTTNYPPAVSLENGIPSTNNVVQPGQLAYFVVDVPPWATAATNILFNATGPLNVWFNQKGAPRGVNPPDFPLLTLQTDASAVLDTSGTLPTPLLQHGQRYYLGVQNPGATPVTFSIEVDYDITTLSNGVPVTGTNSPSLALPRYFRYDVSTNASAVQFTLTNLSGNADLVVRHGLPVPTLTSSDYGSFNPGTNDETIILFTNSVTLTPGTWFLGVYDQDPVPVSYTIEALELTNAFPNIITLTNAVPYINTNAGGTGSNDYYLYVVSTNAARAQFEINNPSADVALLAHKNLPLPDLGNPATYDYLSTNPYPNDQLIVIYPNSAPVGLTAGDWFLTAVNLSGGPASYAIMATEWPTTGTNLNLRGYLNGNSFCLTWDSLVGAHYVVQGKANLSDPAWTDVSPTITATDVTTTYCVPLPTPYNFFNVIEGLALTPPPPTITSITFNGTGITLQWTAPASQQFQVQWTASLVNPVWNTFPNIVTSTNGQFSFTDDGSQSGGLGGVKFYRLVNYP